MILSRFWYLVLIVAAILGIAAALMTATLVDDHYRHATVNDLVRDRFEVEQTLKLDARARLDALAPLAANGDVRTALRRASARDGQAIDEELSSELRQNLLRLNNQLDQMSGDLLFAVDRDGWIVAAIAPTAPPEGAGLGQFPLVRRALEGFIRDDVWVYNEGVYRMAARPVVEGGQYVGAIVHGKRYDDQLARLLSEKLIGASVGFFRGEEGMFAGYMASGAPRREEMGQMLAASVLEDEAFLRGDRTEPLEIDGTGGLAVFSSITGSARFARVGYSIGRPVRTVGSAWTVLSDAGGEQWANLPWVTIAPVGVGLFLIAMLLVWLERDRPLSKLLARTVELEQAPQNRITITDFGGRYRKISNAVNHALDKGAQAAGAGAPKAAAANLDELLGPHDDAPSSGSFFGFAGNDAGPVDLPPVPPQSDSPVGGLPARGKTTSPVGGLPATPKPATSKPATSKPATSKPTPPQRPPAPPRPPSPKSPAKVEAPETPTPAITPSPTEEKPKAPPKVANRRLKSTLLGVAPPDDDEEDEDGATMIARVPQELLRKAGGGGDDEEQAHFREVFEQFVATKKQCGESTKNLTFAKFSVTLKKNRDQIVKRHAARNVRFTVYTKNGKAALKATPIKD